MLQRLPLFVFASVLLACGAAGVGDAATVTPPCQAPSRMEVTSLGALEICAVDSNGGLWCNDRSDMALSEGRDSAPQFMGEGYESVAASMDYTCAITVAIHEVTRPPRETGEFAQPQDRQTRQLRCWRRIHHDAHDARDLVVSLSVRGELSQIAIRSNKVCVFGDAPSACVVFNMASTPVAQSSEQPRSPQLRRSPRMLVPRRNRRGHLLRPPRRGRYAAWVR